MSKEKKCSWKEHYQYNKDIGQGGNAKVMRVRRLSDGSEFALKSLYNRSEEKRSRFIDEIHVMTQNGGAVAGMLPVLESCEEEYWYIMPLAEPVMVHIEKTGPAIQDIVRGVIQLAETLAQLHAKGISHRDIKPSNLYDYNGRYCLGDFGLVEFPEHANDFTRSDKWLGAIFTIAPEMKRNPREADGRKADVYSLAKTMWMLLTGDERGFDGVYQFLDRSHSLRFQEGYRDVHLVELEELLTAATDNNPELRPDMEAFKGGLMNWLDVEADFDRSQASDWNFLNRYLFGAFPPESVVWNNMSRIADVLNVISTLPAYNHMLFSDHGGLDFAKALPANEPGCIYLYDSMGYCFVVKPKCLHYEGFDEAYRWNYFLLELSDLTPVLGEQDDMDYEYLVEDEPGHYVSGRYAQYGVYDYDTGEPLPAGYRVVSRYLRGKFLIVLKRGPYNGISAAYDGRHGMCGSDEFREYIEGLMIMTEGLKLCGIDEEEILNSRVFQKNPFDHSEREGTAPGNYDELKLSRDFVSDHYSGWCFRDQFEVERSEGNIEENIKFFFRFDWTDGFRLSDSSWNKKLYICQDGYIQKLDEDLLDEAPLSEAYWISGRDTALRFLGRCEQFIREEAKAHGFDLPDYKRYFTIELRRSGKPVHLFTKTEIEGVMRAADDRENHMLVIDENGYAKMIQDTDDGFSYPVRHESFCAGNVYVGRYSDLSTLSDNYIASLQGWLLYLKSGRSQYMDYLHDNTDEEVLLRDIERYY